MNMPLCIRTPFRFQDAPPRPAVQTWLPSCLAVLLVCFGFLIQTASFALASDFEPDLEKSSKEDLEQIVEKYVAGYHGADGKLPAIDITFTHLSSEGNSLKIEVTIMPYFHERMSSVRSWLKLAPGLKLVGGRTEWEGSVYAFGHESFEAVIVPDSGEVRSIKAYAIAVEAGGRIMSCYCDYWIKSEGGTMLAAYDRDMKEGVLVCGEAPPDDTPVEGKIKTFEGLPDSVTGMVYAFDKYPQVVYSESAPYPEEASKAYVKGTVLVMVTIDEFGDVENAWIASSDHELLEQSALETARKFKFTPASQRGHRVKATIAIPFRFSLAH